MAFLGIFQQIGALYFVGPILLQNIDDIDDSKFWKFHDGVTLMTEIIENFTMILYTWQKNNQKK